MGNRSSALNPLLIRMVSSSFSTLQRYSPLTLVDGGEGVGIPLFVRLVATLAGTLSVLQSGQRSGQEGRRGGGRGGGGTGGELWERTSSPFSLLDRETFEFFVKVVRPYSKLGGVLHRVPVGRVEKHRVLVACSSPGKKMREIRFRVYFPPGAGQLGAEKLPALLFFHGGAFIFCAATTYDGICCSICRFTRCIVVNVDYSQPPEYPWPTYLEDAYGAALWLRKNADQLGVDIDRVAVAGDSAGGNISSILAQISAHQHSSKAGPAASSKGTENGVYSLPRFCFQVLLYPLLQWTVRFDSYRFGNASLNDSSKRAVVQAEDWFWAGFRSLRSVCLVPIANGQHELASTRARDTSLVVTADYDILRDEGELYAARLAHAKGAVVGNAATTCNVRVVRYAGEPHGFVSFPVVAGKHCLREHVCPSLAQSFYGSSQLHGLPVQRHRRKSKGESMRKSKHGQTKIPTKLEMVQQIAVPEVQAPPRVLGEGGSVTHKALDGAIWAMWNNESLQLLMRELLVVVDANQGQKQARL